MVMFNLLILAVLIFLLIDCPIFHGNQPKRMSLRYWRKNCVLRSEDWWPQWGHVLTSNGKDPIIRWSFMPSWASHQPNRPHQKSRTQERCPRQFSSSSLCTSPTFPISMSISASKTESPAVQEVYNCPYLQSQLLLLSPWQSPSDDCHNFAPNLTATYPSLQRLIRIIQTMFEMLPPAVHTKCYALQALMLMLLSWCRPRLVEMAFFEEEEGKEGKKVRMQCFRSWDNNGAGRLTQLTRI